MRLRKRENIYIVVVGPGAAAVFFFLSDCNGFWTKISGCVVCLIVIVLGPSAAAF